jgi:hypothetical protein
VLIFSYLQLKIILSPKWHILGVAYSDPFIRKVIGAMLRTRVSSCLVISVIPCLESLLKADKKIAWNTWLHFQTMGQPPGTGRRSLEAYQS